MRDQRRSVHRFVDRNITVAVVAGFTFPLPDPGVCALMLGIVPTRNSGTVITNKVSADSITSHLCGDGMARGRSPSASRDNFRFRGSDTAPVADGAAQHGRLVGVCRRERHNNRLTISSNPWAPAGPLETAQESPGSTRHSQPLPRTTTCACRILT